MRPNFWTLCAGTIVASLFLFEAHRSPAVHVVPVPVVPAPAEDESSLEKGVHALPKRPRRGVVVAPAVRTEPAQAPGPSSEPNQPAVSVVPCNSLSCATRHESLEPSWADLRFQPNMDWAGGGVRGDCVAGELEYILPKYCDPVPRDGTAALRRGEKPFPSEQRLAEIDVHTAGLPKALMADLVRTVGNRTILFMGDSVMEQYYNALQCFLRKERLEAPVSPAFSRWIDEVAPLWRMGKRKKPPKLPQAAHGGMRMMYSRVTTMMVDEVEAAVATADIIVLNWGLHYHNMTQYSLDLHTAFEQLNRHASVRGNTVLFMETGAQHFRQNDARGFGRLRASTGSWEMRDPSTDKHCACSPIEDFMISRQNGVLHEVLATGLYPSVQVLPFYELTRPRWRWHFGNCTHRPSGWNKDTCCDCSHYCYSPAMWRAHIEQVRRRLS